jgi:hypothetical protein
MSQGESFRHIVILESRGEYFSHAIFGQADADLELLHVTWMF